MACHDEVVLRQRVCRGSDCQAVFWICRRCDRGQRYCGPACRSQALLQQRRCANRRYQQSPEGRKDHRDRQREHRKRRAQKSVTDKGSATAALPGNMAAWDARSAWTAAPVAAAVAVRQQALPALRIRRELPGPPFLCCVLCGRPGRFIDPFPKVPR
jgi:hypothetical protein